DANGNIVSGPYTLAQTLPPFSQITVHFNEAMSKESIGAYESFSVRFNPDQGIGSEILSDIVLDPTQRSVTIRPVRQDPTTGTFEVVGWGKSIKALQFMITTVPTTTYLQQRLSSTEVKDFLDLGIRSCTDIGGQPLGFPDSFFSSSSPSIVFSIPF